MRGWRYFLVPALLVCATAGVAVPTTAAPSGPDSLRQDLDRILADPRLSGAHAGVVVRDPQTDRILYSRQAQSRITPASNAKLLTSAAALQALGGDYRFHTGVLLEGQQQGGVLNGDLYLRGTGDPTMLAADYDRLAAQVAEAGIREIRGNLVTDDTWFDDVRLGTGWAWDDEPYYYAAPVSALSLAPNTDYDAGTVIVRVTPAAEGQRATVRLEPATSAVEIVNNTTTSAAGTPSSLYVQREHGSNRVIVGGSVPAGGRRAEEFSSVWDSTAYAGDVFARALSSHGVIVGKPPVRGKTPEGARELAGRDSMPLRQLLVPFLKLSNNGHAEVLVKAMGRELRGSGTWDAGLSVLSEKLGELGVDAEALRLVDGSGLSAMDAVSPAQLALLLDNAKQRPWFRDWYTALPVAGAADRLVGGTLQDRMRNTLAQNNVHAKTGSLTGVSSLSGYVTAANGQQLVFSVLLNDFLSSSPSDLEDAIAVRLAQYEGAEDRLRGVPSVPKPRRPADDARTPVDESARECSWSKSC